MDSLDQSILAKAFRGELVPQDPNDEPASVLLERIKAERAATSPGKKPKRKSKTPRSKAKPGNQPTAEPAQTSLDLDPAGPRPDDPPSIRHLIALEDPSITPEMIALLRALHRSEEPRSKAELLDAAGIAAKRWTAAIKALVEAGMVEREGRGRGSKYRLVR